MSMAKEIKWTLFVLDFDDTFDNDLIGEFNEEDSDEFGTRPVVYMVPEEKVEKVEEIAYEAHDAFHADEEGNICIGDYFEEFLEDNHILYKVVGDVNLTIFERCCDWLSDEIHTASI